MPNLVDAHGVQFAERVIVHIICRGNGVSEFSKLDRDLEKISVDPLLRAVYHSLDRRSYSRREIIHVFLLLEKADIKIYRFFDELAARRAVILGKAVIHFFHRLGVEPQRELYFI